MNKISISPPTQTLLPGVIFAGAFALTLSAIAFLVGASVTLVLVPVVLFAVLGLVGYYHYSKLADEVTDCGEHLLVSIGGRRRRIQLEDIEEVAYFPRPPRVRLSFLMPGQKLEKVFFLTGRTDAFLLSNGLAGELESRICEIRARRTHGSPR